MGGAHFRLILALARSSHSHPHPDPRMELWGFPGTQLHTQNTLGVAKASPMLRRKPTQEPGDSAAAGAH